MSVSQDQYIAVLLPEQPQSRVRHLVLASGFLTWNVTPEATSDDWGTILEEPDWIVGPEWLAIDPADIIVHVTLSSLDGVDADYEGWAVDGCSGSLVSSNVNPSAQRVKLHASVRIKGYNAEPEEGVHVNRLSYFLAAKGLLFNPPTPLP